MVSAPPPGGCPARTRTPSGHGDSCHWPALPPRPPVPRASRGGRGRAHPLPSSPLEGRSGPHPRGAGRARGPFLFLFNRKPSGHMYCCSEMQLLPWEARSALPRGSASPLLLPSLGRCSAPAGRAGGGQQAWRSGRPLPLAQSCLIARRSLRHPRPDPDVHLTSPVRQVLGFLFKKPALSAAAPRTAHSRDSGRIGQQRRLTSTTVDRPVK